MDVSKDHVYVVIDNYKEILSITGHITEEISNISSIPQLATSIKNYDCLASTCKYCNARLELECYGLSSDNLNYRASTKFSPYLSLDLTGSICSGRPFKEFKLQFKKYIHRYPQTWVCSRLRCML